MKSLEIDQSSLTLADVLRGRENIHNKRTKFLEEIFRQPTRWSEIKVSPENHGLLETLIAGGSISPKDKAILHQELTKGTNPKVHDQEHYSKPNKEGKPKESGRSSRKRRGRPHRPMRAKISEFWK